MNNIVIGLGEIGTAIQSILHCDGYDITDGEFDYSSHMRKILHICIPYNEKFVNTVSYYADLLGSTLIIIHSSIPVGTCAKFDSKFNIVYSPCRGVHPHLEKGIRTFTKYFAGPLASNAVSIFKAKGIDCVWSKSDRAIESLEAAKLWDTTQYGLNILIEKEIHKYCEENELDFKVVYTMFNESYNRGYDKLDMPQYKKYILNHVDGPIGGHCIIPNAKLLDYGMSKLLWNTEN